MKYLKLTGFAVLIFILWRTDTRELSSVLARSAPLVLLGAFGVSLLSLSLKAFRWQIMLRHLGFAYSLKRAMSVYWSGIFAGLATPGRLGELARAVYVKRDFDTSLGLALSTVVFDRIFDVYALMIVGLLAAHRFEIAGRFSPVFLFVVVIVLVLPLLLLSPSRGRKLAKTLFQTLVKKKLGHVKALAEGTNDFFQGLEKLISWKIAIFGLATAVAYFFFLFAGYLISQSLQIDIRAVDAALILGLANLLALIPVTIAGVGTRDAVFIFGFSFLALNRSEALAFSALVLVVFYLGSAAIGFVCFMSDRSLATASGERSKLQPMPKQHKPGQ